jgi:hypothetical protein
MNVFYWEKRLAIFERWNDWKMDDNRLMWQFIVHRSSFIISIGSERQTSCWPEMQPAMGHGSGGGASFGRLNGGSP